MMRLLSSLRRLGRAARREDGTATVEFVILFPIFIAIMFQAFEVGWITVRQTMLDHALDLAVRELRLGHFTNPTNDTLRTYICNHTAGVIADCNNSMLIELTPVDTSTWALPPPNATCINRDAKLQPVTTVQQGSGDQLMIVRACAIINLMFPLVGVGPHLTVDSKGGMAIAASSAFVNEPG
ncbi:TadE/TadG family type IV pilus assembly protein [Solirhodobacter olei]|uniref:TadE/TadG family type IV pilus assembly protein n=1 Tax=Solirhodobacter olei TaxID=2493082 RepID=UPI000FD71EC1|nr:TadE family protein [Solirhodobacter olei]